MWDVNFSFILTYSLFIVLFIINLLGSIKYGSLQHKCIGAPVFFLVVFGIFWRSSEKYCLDNLDNLILLSLMAWALWIYKYNNRNK